MENKAGHKRTVLVGDLNMNPFETGLVTASGLNATMTRKLPRRKNGQSMPGVFLFSTILCGAC